MNGFLAWGKNANFLGHIQNKPINIAYKANYLMSYIWVWREIYPSIRFRIHIFLIAQQSDGMGRDYLFSSPIIRQLSQ